MRASEFITESVQEVTLNDLYHDNYPDQDELIWNYVGKNDFDTQFTVRKINPLDLEEMLCDNYGVDDVQDLFKKMQPEQEDIVSNYQNDPTLSQKIIVTSGRRILDGNHRALAAVLARKPIKYIDVSEEQPERIDESQTVSAKHIYDLAKKIHRRLDDFSTGDLTDRIYWFDEYTLTDLPVSKINAEEFNVDQDLVAKHVAKIMKATDTMPPIVYDPIAKSVIDGIHRVNAYIKLGYRTIPAYVGSKKSDSYGLSDEEIDEGLRDIAAAGIASLGLMGAPNLAAASTHAPPQTHTQAQTKAPAAPAAKAKTTAKTPAKSTVKTLSGHPDRETILHKAAAKAGMKGTELAQFLAQTKHESWDFGKLKERGTSDDFKKYDIRFNPDTARILGNTQAGDGERYCGRGFIQLTGRYNYRKAGEALNLPLEKKPELAARPDIAARIAVWFWKSRVKPHVDNFKDTTAVTKQINPGLMGLRSRKQNFLDYTHLLAKK